MTYRLISAQRNDFQKLEERYKYLRANAWELHPGDVVIIEHDSFYEEALVISSTPTGYTSLID